VPVFNHEGVDTEDVFPSAEQALNHLS
jgi:hypothetical protein